MKGDTFEAGSMCELGESLEYKCWAFSYDIYIVVREADGRFTRHYGIIRWPISEHSFLRLACEDEG